MSCEVYGNVNPLFSPDEIVTYLRSFVDNLTIHRSNDVVFLNFFTVNFNFNGQKRTMFFHVNQGIFKSHCVSMHHDGDGFKIVSKILNHFGGVLTSDAWDNAEVYEGKWREGDGSVFIHRWAFVNGYVDGVRLEDAQEADRLFIEKVRKI